MAKKKILQGEINCLMVALAAAGLRVVRLKGGDPLIFGRAGEEIESLRANNIPFEIVPGVTSAMGAAAAAQIPLTHRRASDALVLITAHRASEKAGADREAANWSKLATSGATLVIYMPGQNYSQMSKRLITADSPARRLAPSSRALRPNISEPIAQAWVASAAHHNLLLPLCS